MAQKDRAALNAQADQIKNETVKDANSTARVGQILNDLADSQSNLVDDPQSGMTFIKNSSIDFEAGVSIEDFDINYPLNISIAVTGGIHVLTFFDSNFNPQFEIDIEVKLDYVFNYSNDILLMVVTHKTGDAINIPEQHISQYVNLE